VQAYDSLDVFVTQNTTALSGGESYCELMLNGEVVPEVYTIRMSKTGVSFDGLLGDDSKTPQSIDVYSPAAGSPTGTNYFSVQGQTRSLPTATDPRMCRCSGYFVDMSGRPLANMDIHFIPVCYNEDQADLSPLVVDGIGVMGDKIITRTDADGYVEIDLYRVAEVSALVQGFAHSRRVIKVPDASSVSLLDLLFPVVSEITFVPNPLSVAVSAYSDVVLTIMSSDGQTLDPLDRDVVFTSSDVGVATVQLQEDGTLRIMGVASGATTIEATRSDTSIVTFPDQPVTYTALAITVT
jgi:hypothetical protein